MKGLHKIRQKWNDSKLGRNDISVRIYLSFVVVLAVSLLLTGAIFNYLYQRNYTRSYTELLTKQGKKIARRVSKFQYKKNIGQYEKYSVYIDEIESAENTDVWILSNHKAKNALKEDFTNAEMNDDNLTDEMYEKASMHNENGAWQMIFGVNTLPAYRKQGYAGELIREAIRTAKNQGRKGLVLTCKDALVPYYTKFGFQNEGISGSVHGNVVWNQMRLVF